MTLSSDKYRIVDKKQKLIAPKGSEVTLISWHGDVAIVEYQGERFSVKKEQLIIQK